MTVVDSDRNTAEVLRDAAEVSDKFWNRKPGWCELCGEFRTLELYDLMPAKIATSQIADGPEGLPAEPIAMFSAGWVWACADRRCPKVREIGDD